MLVPFRSRPHRRERHHMGEVQRRDRRLSYVGVNMTGKAPEPGLKSVHTLTHAGEIPPLDDLFDQPQPLVGEPGILVPNRHGGGDIGLTDHVGAEFLQREIGVHRLVGGVAIHQHRRLVGHHLLQDRHDRLALGEPLAADAPHHPGRVGLVETNGAGRPAIGESEAVQIIKEAWPGLGRETHDRQRAQVRPPEPGLQAAGQVFIGEDGVQMHRRFWDAHPMAAGRDAGVQIGEGLGVIQPLGLGHEALDQGQDPVRAIDEAGQGAAPIGSAPRAALVEPGLGPRGVLGRRQPDEGQEIPALEMRAFFFELRSAFGVHQAGDRIGKLRRGIAVRRLALRLDENRPAGTEAPQGIVEPGRDRHQFGRCRRIQIRSPEPRCPLKRPVLVEDDALTHQRRPGEEVGEALGLAAIFGEVEHGSPHATRCCG